VNDHDPGERVEQALAGAWQGTALPDVLAVVVDGVVRVAGFGAAALSVRTDADGLEVVAVAGDQQGVRELVGSHLPRHRVELELAMADRWGRLRFVPHERMTTEIAEMPTWIPDIEPLDVPDAWHPLDLLLAPLVDDDGELLALLSVDLPDGGRRPGPDQLRVLEMYVEQASRALARALERDRLARQVQLARTTREVVRRATTRLSIEEILQECRRLMTDAFRAKGMWIDIPPTDDGLDEGHASVTSVEHPELVVPADLVAGTRRVAARCWHEQRVALFSHERDRTDLAEPDEQRLVLDFLATIDRTSLLLAPLGAGPQCLGTLALSRGTEDTGWSEVETQAALDIGHDLGAAVLNARMRQRDQRLVEDLRAIDGYKSKVISTIAHEFKNPLTTITGHLELLAADGAAGADGAGGAGGAHPPAASLAAMARGATRLVALVEQLLALHRVSDPAAVRTVGPVDLADCLREAAALMEFQATDRTVTLDTGPDCVVTGVRSELDALCANLVGNALKYTGAGGRVRAEVRRTDDGVVLVVSDDGIGISAADQGRLFEEFFRSAEPEAAGRPGTGLGLAIAARVVDRHGGTIEVESAAGRGSTFRVRLPFTAPESVTSARRRP
jgi:signal transduction histidine kinase